MLINLSNYYGITICIGIIFLKKNRQNYKNVQLKVFKVTICSIQHEYIFDITTIF